MSIFGTNENRYPERYERHESAYGMITSRSSNAAYVTLENGEVAISYNCCNLPSGTRIICSVTRAAVGHRHAVVVCESVCAYEMSA